MNIDFKKTKYIALALLLGFLMLIPNLIVEAAPNVTVKVDGNTVSFPDQKPYIDSNDRTMVPVRAPMEAMGCKVEWNDKTRQATITKAGNTAVFTIGSNTYTVNGAKKTMDTQAVITGDRTAFPIRFAAEAMGARVDWDASTYTVNIYTQAQDTEARQVTIDCYKLPDKVSGTLINDYPEFKVYAWPLAVKFVSKDEKEYRFVCTSHPGLNEAMQAAFGETIKTETKLDTGFYGQHTIANGLGYLTEIKVGMTIKYDIYNEADTKIYEMTFQM